MTAFMFAPFDFFIEPRSDLMEPFDQRQRLQIKRANLLESLVAFSGLSRLHDCLHVCAFRFFYRTAVRSDGAVRPASTTPDKAGELARIARRVQRAQPPS